MVVISEMQVRRAPSQWVNLGENGTKGHLPECNGRRDKRILMGVQLIAILEKPKEKSDIRKD